MDSANHHSAQNQYDNYDDEKYLKCTKHSSLRDQFTGRRCITLNTVGTKNNVAAVAKIRPPITARPSGAFCSPPSPRPSAIGIIPMIMAKAVIMTGRKRGVPASIEAVIE